MTLTLLNAHAVMTLLRKYWLEQVASFVRSFHQFVYLCGIYHERVKRNLFTIALQDNAFIFGGVAF